MRALLGMAVALALAWGGPAAAVIIASGNGTGNISAPPDDPGWDNVVNLTGLTGVYLGNGWVLTEPPTMVHTIWHFSGAFPE